jgi:hypothetical protein
MEFGTVHVEFENQWVRRDRFKYESLGKMVGFRTTNGLCQRAKHRQRSLPKMINSAAKQNESVWIGRMIGSRSLAKNRSSGQVVMIIWQFWTFKRIVLLHHPM